MTNRPLIGYGPTFILIGFLTLVGLFLLDRYDYQWDPTGYKARRYAEDLERQKCISNQGYTYSPSLDECNKLPLKDLRSRMSIFWKARSADYAEQLRRDSEMYGF